MTLNSIIALILLYFTEFDNFALQAIYVIVVEDKPILSKFCLQNIVFNF